MDALDDDTERWYHAAVGFGQVVGQCVTILACTAGNCEKIGQVCPAKENDT